MTRPIPSPWDEYDELQWPEDDSARALSESVDLAYVLGVLTVVAVLITAICLT